MAKAREIGVSENVAILDDGGSDSFSRPVLQIPLKDLDNSPHLVEHIKRMKR